MNEISALWVDMRLRKLPSALPQTLASACRVTIAHGVEDLHRRTRLIAPHMIAFDFDYPDVQGLQALLHTRQAFTRVPVLMLTEQCYDNLLLWALRARVWDVLIKPVADEQVLRRVEWICAARAATGPTGTRNNAMPVPAIPMEARFAPANGRPHRTDSACGYVHDHLHEKLSTTTLARRCGMSRYEFSRTFHSEHGVTFRDYLLAVRLQRAAEMLSRTDAPITEIAFCAGFHDLSHFASLFRRRTGCSPSEFRQRQRPTT